MKLPVAVVSMLSIAVALSACGSGAGTPADDAAAAAPDEPRLVDELPLKRGYYVSSEVSCGEASNASLRLLQNGGMSGSSHQCAFERIEQTGENTYKVTESCADFRDPQEAEVNVTVYTVDGEAAFHSKSEQGWEYKASYCEQSSLPEPWRDNDISELIN